MTRSTQTQETAASDTCPCRMVTAEEAARYREFGWVELKIALHSHLRAYGAGKNQLNRPHLDLPQPVDAVWNGAPPEAFDPSGMKAYQPFDDARFPPIA